MGFPRYSRRISVLFLTPGRDAPASINRIQQYLPKLARAGIKATVLHCTPDKYFNPRVFQPLGLLLFLPLKLFSRLIGIACAPFYDVVFLQRELIPYTTPFLERLLWLANKNIVFDFEDAIFLRYKKENNPVARVIQLAKHVMVASQFQADFARRYHPCVTVIPMAIDTERYHPTQKVPKETVDLVWMGSPSNLPFLLDINPVLKRVFEKYKNVRLFLICGERPPEDALPVPYHWVPWHRGIEETVHRYDIGLSPLPDTDWCRGKFPHKTLQYMAVGIPCVASAVGTNSEVVVNGETGFLATSTEEWVSVLSRLIESKDLQCHMGQKARESAVQRYGLDVHFPTLLKVLQEAATANKMG